MLAGFFLCAWVYYAQFLKGYSNIEPKRKREKDQLSKRAKVEARHVLKAAHEIKRTGHTRTMNRLEQRHPDLLDHTLEELSNFYRQLLELGPPPRKARQLYRSIEALLLTCISAFDIHDQQDRQSRSSKNKP